MAFYNPQAFFAGAPGAPAAFAEQDGFADGFADVPLDSSPNGAPAAAHSGGGGGFGGWAPQVGAQPAAPGSPQRAAADASDVPFGAPSPGGFGSLASSVFATAGATATKLFAAVPARDAGPDHGAPTRASGSFGEAPMTQQQQPQQHQRQQQAEMFGAPPAAQQDMFGAAPPSAFGAAPPSAFSAAPPPAFGAAPPAAAAASLFGEASTTAAFGAAPPTAFGAAPPTAFGAAPPTTFGAAPPTAFGAAPPTAFSTAPPTAFGAAPPTAFGAAPPTAATAPMFGAPAAGAFGARDEPEGRQPDDASALFGSSASTDFHSPETALFGAATAPPSGAWRPNGQTAAAPEEDVASAFDAPAVAPSAAPLFGGPDDGRPEVSSHFFAAGRTAAAAPPAARPPPESSFEVPGFEAEQPEDSGASTMRDAASLFGAGASGDGAFGSGDDRGPFGTPEDVARPPDNGGVPPEHELDGFNRPPAAAVSPEETSTPFAAAPPPFSMTDAPPTAAPPTAPPPTAAPPAPHVAPPGPFDGPAASGYAPAVAAAPAMAAPARWHKRTSELFAPPTADAPTPDKASPRRAAAPARGGESTQVETEEYSTGRASVSLRSGRVFCSVEVVDLGPKQHVATGICFLNHMVDQIQSHAQLGVQLQVQLDGIDCHGETDYCDQLDGGQTRKPAVRPHDSAIFRIAGEALGKALGHVVFGDSKSGAAKSHFKAPLDESLVECTIERSEAEPRAACELSPYGDTPRGGRLWIGHYRTCLTPLFWAGIARGLGCAVHLRKISGVNAHHIVEAAFKSFARAARQLIDSLRPLQSLGPTPRVGRAGRETKETAVDAQVGFETQDAEVRVETGLPSLDLVISSLASAAAMHCVVTARGDTWIDDHHSIEDVSIVVGTALDHALGDRAGCNRMGCATVLLGSASGARVDVVVDLSNRPHCEWQVPIQDEWLWPETREFASEMLQHLFNSVATAGRMTLHVRLDHAGAPRAAVDSGRVAVAAAQAFGEALKMAAKIDPRRAGTVASSKGAL
ncbi:Imidazoleglycerol-phosphate dehydratase-domain-containing protein [Pelagophyceae sp. CCMP2097]|nr:Imidazoleglycerol-phosphate dehydratase-domain-containing protein [Pelagophyceae sp. CCMP2097]